MPRQRIPHRRRVYLFPNDFPERLKLLKEESGLSWAEIARRLGVDPLTVRRWWKYGVRPSFRHQMALLKLADDLGLVHILTAWDIEDVKSGSDGRGRSSERVAWPGAPTRCRSMKRKGRTPARRLQARA